MAQMRCSVHLRRIEKSGRGERHCHCWHRRRAHPRLQHQRHRKHLRLKHGLLHVNNGARPQRSQGPHRRFRSLHPLLGPQATRPSARRPAAASAATPPPPRSSRCRRRLSPLASAQRARPRRSASRSAERQCTPAATRRSAARATSTRRAPAARTTLMLDDDRVRSCASRRI
eukprot:2717872-Pleurochrysis_carterae.AAC.1